MTIVSGNLTLSSPAAGEHRAAGLPYRSPDRLAPGQGTSHQRAGDAIVAGLSGPGTRGTAPGSIKLGSCGAGRQRAFQGLPGGGCTRGPRPDLGIRVAVRDGALTGVSVRTLTGKTAAGTLAGTYARGLAQLAHALGPGAVAGLPGHRDGRRCARRT